MKFINYAGSQWAKWDLHIHSNASDGKMTPEEIIHKAKDEGLEVIALTDHHTVKNIDEIKNLGEKNGIKVISGVEFRTEYGSSSVHMIGLFPDRYNGIELTQNALEDLVLVCQKVWKQERKQKRKLLKRGCLWFRLLLRKQLI